MSTVLFHCACAYVLAIAQNSFVSLVRFIFLNWKERKKKLLTCFLIWCFIL